MMLFLLATKSISYQEHVFAILLVIMESIDIYLFFVINHLPHPIWLNNFASFIHTITYGGLVYYPLFLAMLIFGTIMVRRVVKLATVSMLITYILTDLVVKNILRVQRPYELLKEAIYIPTAPQSYSFPSGQTAVAFAFAVILYNFLPEKKWGALAIIWAVLVGLDRIYMAHHFPSDVVTGALIGTLVSALTYRYAEK